MQGKTDIINDSERLKIYLKSLDEDFANSTLSFLHKVCECPNQLGPFPPRLLPTSLL